MSDQEKKPLNNWARFSSMGIQMGVIITLGFFAGQKLDQKLGSRKPWFTLLLGLVGVFGGIYLVIKEVKNMSKDD